jgi:hypothetical protein
VVEHLSYLTRRRQEAIEQVQHWIAEKLPGAVRLTAHDLRMMALEGTWDGWQLPIPVYHRYLDLILDANFPYSFPRFRLNKSDNLTRAPHIERDGLLCLAGEDGRADTLNPVDVVAYSYAEALALISEDQVGEHRADYILDFELYWRRDTTCSMMFSRFFILNHAAAWW